MTSTYVLYAADDGTSFVDTHSDYRAIPAAGDLVGTSRVLAVDTDSRLLCTLARARNENHVYSFADALTATPKTQTVTNPTMFMTSDRAGAWTDMIRLHAAN